MRTCVIGGVTLILKLEALSFRANEKMPSVAGHFFNAIRL